MRIHYWYKHCPGANPEYLLRFNYIELLDGPSICLNDLRDYNQKAIHCILYDAFNRFGVNGNPLAEGDYTFAYYTPSCLKYDMTSKIVACDGDYCCLTNYPVHRSASPEVRWVDPSDPPVSIFDGVTDPDHVPPIILWCDPPYNFCWNACRDSYTEFVTGVFQNGKRSYNFDIKSEVIPNNSFIQPNPSNIDAELIYLSQNDDLITVVVNNIAGVKVIELKQRVSSSITTLNLNLKSLESGVYFYNIIGSESKILSKGTFVVEK
jgi:hypothetical protein